MKVADIERAIRFSAAAFGMLRPRRSGRENHRELDHERASRGMWFLTSLSSAC
jgi:hypothetical protein